MQRMATSTCCSRRSSKNSVFAKIKNFSLGTTIAYVFIFLLPFRMLWPINSITNVLGAVASFSSFVFHFFGIVLMIIDGDFKMPKPKIEKTTIGIFVLMILYFVFNSVIASLLMNITYGSYNGVSNIASTFKIVLNFIQYLMIIIYSIYAVGKLGFEKVFKVISWSLVVVLFIGYFQLILSTPLRYQLTPLYSFFAKLLNLATFDFTKVGISLTFYEPSHAAVFIGCIVLPFYISQLVYFKKNQIFNLIMFVLWLPIIVFTRSTTTYLIVAIEVLASTILVWFTRGIKLYIRIIFSSAIILGIIIFVFPEIVDKLTGFNFSYLLKDKLIDGGNQSTNSRYYTLFLNFEIFKHYPIFGCGNGLQGYFYSIYKNIIPSIEYIDDSSLLAYNHLGTQIANGSLFFPSVFSGYGIIGAILLFSFFTFSIYSIYKKKEKGQQVFIFYILALVSLIISGIKSDFVGIYFIWFVLSFPFCEFNIKQQQNNLIKNENYYLISI